MNEINRKQGAERVGQVKEVTSLANPLVKDIKALSQKKTREETGTFLAEGLKLIIDAVELGWSVRYLLYSKAAKGKPLVEKVAARTVARGGMVLEVSEKVMASITRKDNPQMVAAVFDQRWQDLASVKLASNQTWVALDRVRDPGNLGTIIRTADAAGASGVMLIDDCTDPFSMETVRATMGSIFAIPLVKASSQAFMAWKKQAGIQLVATHLAGAVDYRRIDYKAKPNVILMGNEQSGLPQELATAADRLARIPQTGLADSLNLAIATGIMLFEARRHLLTLDDAP